MKFLTGDRVELIYIDVFFFLYLATKFKQPLCPGEIGIVTSVCECQKRLMTDVAWDVGAACIPNKWLKKIDDDGSTNTPGTLEGTGYKPKILEVS